MEIFAIIGLLISCLNYRAAKADRSLAVDSEVPDEENSVQQPLRPGAGRLERLAHWLGLNEN